MMPIRSSRALERRATLTRFRARRRAEGAVLFVTATTLALLASLGLYALTTTRGEVSASGYMSRVSLTEGIEQWAENAAMSDLTNEGPSLISIAQNNTAYGTSATASGCQALANVPSSAPPQTKACQQKFMAAYLTSVTGTTPPILWSPTGRTMAASPDFFTEMTNVDQGTSPCVGYGTTNAVARLVTVTTYGILRMNGNAAALTGTQIVHQGRGHLTLCVTTSGGNTTS
jgi:hypothetical protein